VDASSLIEAVRRHLGGGEAPEPGALRRALVMLETAPCNKPCSLAGTARDIRDAVWARLASDWKPATLDRIDQGDLDLAGLPAVFQRMLAGGSLGRRVVRLDA